jgi:hypothetical protein
MLPCVVHEFTGLSPVFVCVCIYIYVCVYMSNMDLPLRAHKCSECLVRCCCNNFAVIADKMQYVVHGFAGLLLRVCVCVYIYVCVCVYISNMDLPLWAHNCSENFLRFNFNLFAVTSDKKPCVEHGLAGMSLCVCLCVCISNMDLPMWARNCSESLVRGNCNHFVVTVNIRPCVVHALAGLSLCVCLYIYICVCICIYIFI